jgi:hypothetical protein
MKLFSHNLSAVRAARSSQGFTLVEAMIAVAVMLVVIGGVLSANFLGMREDQLMESKAGANDMSRRTIGQMLYDIRSAKGFDIGNLSGTNFITITNGTLQGGAVKLYMISMMTNQVIDPNRYILYYFDSSQASNLDGVLWKMNSTNGQSSVVASNLIPPLNFTAEDYSGTTQSVRSYKNVIHTKLQFSQFLYPVTSVGSNGLYNSYSLDCRASLHIPDGQ